MDIGKRLYPIVDTLLKKNRSPPNNLVLIVITIAPLHK